MTTAQSMPASLPATPGQVPIPSSASAAPLLAQAESCLLEPYELDSFQLERVFGTLLGHRVDYADLYFQYHRTEGWSLEEGIVKSGSFNIEQGVGVRAISGEKTAFAYSDEISFPALQGAARATRAIAASGQLARAPLRLVTSHRPLYSPADPLRSLADADKIALLNRLEQFARAEDPRVTEVMASVAGSWEVVLVARSDGRLAADVRPLVRVSVTVLMEEKGKAGAGLRRWRRRSTMPTSDDVAARDYACSAACTRVA